MVGFGKKRGLASIEYLFVAGLSLSALAVIIIVGMGMGNDSVRVTQAKDTVDSLGKAADYVYALGPGSKETVSVWLPQGIIFVNASGNQLHMRVGLSSGETDVYAKTNGQLIGGIRPIAGAQEVTITAIGNGRVLIGRPGLACEPAAMTRTIPQGGTGTASIIVTNTAGYNITGIAAGKSGAISAMTDVTQPASALAPGASSSVGLAFSVPAAQAVGSYGGLITVAGSNESECSSSITLFVTRPGAPDTVGPVVTNINHAPPAPHTCSQITITASADDTGTGNSPILGCQLELDGSGIWNSVQAGDGAYDEPQEDIAYPLGSIGLGDHTVRIRCTDSAGNTGSPSSHTFSVSAFASRPILFISSGGSSNPWSGWMAAHQSNMSLSWSYDQNTTAQVESGLIDLMAYKIVIMDMSDNNPTLNAMLNDFRSSGRYVVLLGNGVDQLQYLIGGGAGNQGTGKEITVAAIHPITQGYDVGSIYGISPEPGVPTIYYSGAGVTYILRDRDNVMGVLVEADHVLAYGPRDPDKFNSNGNAFAVRSIDYALLNSAEPGGGCG